MALSKVSADITRLSDGRKVHAVISWPAAHGYVLSEPSRIFYAKGERIARLEVIVGMFKGIFMKATRNDAHVSKLPIATQNFIE